MRKMANKNELICTSAMRYIKKPAVITKLIWKACLTVVMNAVSFVLHTWGKCAEVYPEVNEGAWYLYIPVAVRE